MKLLFIGDFDRAGNQLLEVCTAEGFACESALTFEAGRGALDEPAAIVYADAAFLKSSAGTAFPCDPPVVVLLDDPAGRSVVVDRMKRGAANCLGRGEWNELPGLLREEIESNEKRRKSNDAGKIIAAERLRLLGRLAAGAVHEVNNALTAILNFAAVLARGLPEGREREMIESIRTESRRIAELAGGVQSLAKNGGAARALATAPFLREFERGAARFLKRDRITFELTAGEDLPDLFGVPEELEMVLYLLAFQITTNARREPAGTTRHTIRLSAVSWCAGAALRVCLATATPNGYEAEAGVDAVVPLLMKKNGGGYTRESGAGEERFILILKSASAAKASS